VFCNGDIRIANASCVYRLCDKCRDAVLLISDIGDLVVSGFKTVSRSNLSSKDIFSDRPPSERNPFPFELSDILNVGILSHYDMVCAAEVGVDGDGRVWNPFLQADQKWRRRCRVDVDGTGDHGIATFTADAEAPPVNF